MMAANQRNPREGGKPVSTATAEPTGAREGALSKPDTTILYMSRRSELKLVKKPIRKRHDVEGNVIETIPGQRLAFRDGQLRVPPAGQLRGENGEALDAAEVNAWLVDHPLNGDRLEGFWRVDQPPPPPSDGELAALTELAQEGDIEGLRRFVAAESDGWARGALLEPAERALERARERQEKQQEALDAARREGEAAARAPKGRVKPETKEPPAE